MGRGILGVDRKEERCGMTDVDIFVSYSSDAKRLQSWTFDCIHNFFEGIGLKVYFFSRDNSAFGDPLRQEMRAAIAKASHVLVILSPAAASSEWVKFEMECAKAYCRDIVVLCKDNSHLNDLPNELRNNLALTYSTPEALDGQLSKHNWGCTAFIPAAGFGGAKVEFCPHVPKALCPIGDRPMLFHVIDSLRAPLIKRVQVVNNQAQVHDYVKYITDLKYAGNADSRNRHGFEGSVRCVSTKEGNWPVALKALAPKSTFVVQLCDVILSFNSDGGTIDRSEHWKTAFELHKKQREKWGDNYLGTLLTCNEYHLSAGIIEKFNRDDPYLIEEVRENPAVRGQNVGLYMMNTGTAILEPNILEFIKDEDESLLGGAIQRVLQENRRITDSFKTKKFAKFEWPHWNHVMHVIDWRNLHRQRLAQLGL
jgi:NDP-sugar pyrophosphorylase family protein